MLSYRLVLPAMLWLVVGLALAPVSARAVDDTAVQQLLPGVSVAAPVLVGHHRHACLTVRLLCWALI